MYAKLLQSDFAEKYLTTRKQEVGSWFAQFAMEELRLLEQELASFRKPSSKSNRSTLIVGNISYPLFQHLSPALAARQRGDKVSLLLPHKLPHTKPLLEELALTWSITTLSNLQDFDFDHAAESFLWWQSEEAIANSLLDSFTATSLCIPSPIPFFMDESANLDQIKTLVRVLFETQAPGFLPKQFWVPSSLASEMIQYLHRLGEQTIQGEVGSVDFKDGSALYLLTYRSVRQVTEAITKQGMPNIIYWFSRYKPTVKAAQQVASLCGIALNGILPNIRQQEMEIGPHRAHWVGT
ncbi:MAG: hypothetical protein AAGH79_18905, partial [Bacteroidota bacterium]